MIACDTKRCVKNHISSAFLYTSCLFWYSITRGQALVEARVDEPTDCLWTYPFTLGPSTGTVQQMRSPRDVWDVTGSMSVLKSQADHAMMDWDTLLVVLQ